MKNPAILILPLIMVCLLTGCADRIPDPESSTAETTEAIPLIDLIMEQAQHDALTAVLPDFSDAAAVDSFPDATGMVTDVYRSESGYAMLVTVSGFDGPITMAVGISGSGEILGLSLIHHTETAGLGAIAGADSEAGRAFRSQFVGKTGELALKKDGGDIDTVSGATTTSRAVIKGVNAALACAGALDP